MAKTYERLPTITQLRHLIALDEHRHFGKAAESCMITQSSLSISIKELETTLGVTLVERTRRSVMMTSLGNEIAARAKKVITDVSDLTGMARSEGGVLSGAVRLGVIPTIAPFLLPRTLPGLRRAYPDLKLFLREDKSASLVHLLASGDLDVLLIAFPYDIAGLKSVIFADDPFWAAFPKGHENARRERVPSTLLKNENLLLLEEGNCLRDHALGACRLNTMSGNVDFQGTSLHTLLQMVDNGLGVTLLPKMAVDAGIGHSTKTILRPLDGRETSRQIGLAWRPTSPREVDFLTLSDFLRDELATPIKPGKRK